MPAILTLLAFFGISIYVLVQNKKLAKESCFFRDVVEVIEELEKEQNMISGSVNAY